MYSFRRIVKALYWLSLGSASQRRRVRQECARVAAGLFGDFPLSEDHKLWREDREFLNDYARVSPDNPYSQDRKYVLRELARFVGDVPGSMAECGSFRGASAYFLAKENPLVPLHLFDSFEGLGQTNREDSSQKNDVMQWRAGDLKATEDDLRRTLAGFTNYRIHKGWIPEPFSSVADEERFRLVHIDVDLYEPTLESLKFFYPRLNPGGVIILDDYGFTTCPGAHRATVDFMTGKRECILHLPTGQGVIIITGFGRP
jgi:O-methyltransferase